MNIYPAYNVSSSSVQVITGGDISDTPEYPQYKNRHGECIVPTDWYCYTVTTGQSGLEFIPKSHKHEADTYRKIHSQVRCLDRPKRWLTRLRKSNSRR
jgi:hypothetical protein